MESELTRQIKRGLTRFKLDMPTSMRTVRYAEEVWTPTGVVDFIRFEDCKTNYQTQCKLIDHSKFDPVIIAAISPKFTRGVCKIEGGYCPSPACRNCVFRHDTYDVGHRITCFEVKISKDDYRSEHGHNFHGHHNYYVMPKELAYELKDDIPAHIGLIAYFPNSNTYRVVKECVPQEVSPEAAARLLYNAFKKWVDKFQDDYWSTVHKTEYVSHHFGKPTQGEILW